jgi:hypothetical protein
MVSFGMHSVKEVKGRLHIPNGESDTFGSKLATKDAFQVRFPALPSLSSLIVTQVENWLAGKIERKVKVGSRVIAHDSTTSDFAPSLLLSSPNDLTHAINSRLHFIAVLISAKNWWRCLNKSSNRCKERGMRVGKWTVKVFPPLFLSTLLASSPPSANCNLGL